MDLTDIVIKLASLQGKPVRIMVAPHSDMEELQISFDGKCKHSIVLSGNLTYRGGGIWNVCTEQHGKPFEASDIAFFEAYDVEVIKDNEIEPPMIFVSWG